MVDHTFRPTSNGPACSVARPALQGSVPGTSKWPRLGVLCGSQVLSPEPGPGKQQDEKGAQRESQGVAHPQRPPIGWGHQGLAHLSRTHSRASPLGSRAIQNLCCSVVLQRAFKGQAEVPLARRYLLTLTLDIVTLYKSGRSQGHLDRTPWQPQPKTLGHQVPALQHSIQLQD